MLNTDILFLCLILGAAYSEPECSRFHYEEKTLEKVIKLDFLVQQLKADLEATTERVAQMKAMLDKLEMDKINGPFEGNDDTNEKILRLEADLQNLKGAAYSEPECSRFHYEEKTLEKVIKLDFLVQQLKADLEATTERVAQMKAVLDKLEMDKINGPFEGNDDTNEKILRLEADLQNLKEFTQLPAIAFVGKDVVNSKPSSDQTLVFNTTVWNEGNGYDNTTGIFLVPVQGTYSFTIQLCVNPGKWLGYALVADGKVLKKGWFNDKDISTCGTADALAVLNKGSRVSVTFYGEKDASLYASSAWWNSFSGVRIQN